MDVIDEFGEAVLAGLAGRGGSLWGFSGGAAAASALHHYLYLNFINLVKVIFARLNTENNLTSTW